MTRYLKGLGLALFAVCALGAVGASTASATTDVFTCGTLQVANCDVTGANVAGTKSTFGTKSSTLTTTCNTEIYHGTVTNKSTSIMVTPTYSGCQVEPFGAATVDTTGCHYILTGETTTHLKTDNVTNETDARFKIDCTTEGGVQKSIKITGPGCTIEIAGVTPNTGHGAEINQKLHGVKYDKEGAGETDDIKVTFTLDGIHYTTAGFACGIAGLPATGNDMTCTGSITLKGYKHNSAHGTGDHVALTYHEVA